MKALRYQIEWLLCRFAAWAIPKLPLSFVHLLAELAGRAYFALDGKGRRVALENLRVAFQDRYTVSERTTIARASAVHFARIFLELFWSPRLNQSNYRKYFEFQDLRPELSGKQGIYICIHAGNFEWMSHALGFNGLTGHIIAQEFKNPKLDPIFSTLRQSAGQNIVTKKSAMLRLFKELKRGSSVAMLTDLTLKRQEPHVVIRAFGLNMRVTFIHAFLHLRTGAPIVPIANEPIGHGRYRVTMYEPLTLEPGLSETEITQRCWDFFEKWITERPELWLWSYKYFRQKDPARPEAYPDYAR